MLIGFTFDRWFSKRLAKDAFLATFGYVFPEVVKGEVSALAEHGVIVKRLDLTLGLRPEGDDHLCQLRLERRYQNVTAITQEYEHRFALDEWGEGSEIVSMSSWFKGEVTHESVEDPNRWTRNVARVAPPVLLGPGDEVTKTDMASFRKRKEDSFVLFVRHFSSDVEIKVTTPDGIASYVDIASAKPERLKPYADGYRLEGALLPYQAIRIRWWRERDLN